MLLKSSCNQKKFQVPLKLTCALELALFLLYPPEPPTIYATIDNVTSCPVVSSKGLTSGKDSDQGQSISSISFQEEPASASNRLAEVKCKELWSRRLAFSLSLFHSLSLMRQLLSVSFAARKRALCSSKRDSLVNTGPLVVDKVKLHIFAIHALFD